jgi:hypothetical protein
MSEPECRSCRFARIDWCENDNGSRYPLKVECRRYAPRPSDTAYRGKWLEVAQGDWCGEYEPKPEPPK